MKLTTVFHISIYTFACLANFMLAYAEGSLFPHIFTIPLMTAAFFLNERKKIIRLPTMFANILGILAFLLAGGELFYGDVEARVLSGAHLLVYLSWIVFFQEKNVGQFWWMCVLGILQVTVGSLLTISELYGLFLLLYLFTGIWTLTVYSLYQGRQQFLASQQSDQDSLAAGYHPSGETSAPGESVGAKRFQSISKISSPLLQESQATGSIRLDPGERWLNSRLVFSMMGFSFLTLFIAGVVFLSIPRIWIGSRVEFRDDPTEPANIQSGFAEEVKLGDIGSILESTRRVLQVRLYDHKTGEEIDVDEYSASLGYDEPLFRGSVLGDYRNGRWRSGNPVFGSSQIPRSRLNGAVRQEIQMEPLNSDILFALYPVWTARTENRRSGVRIFPINCVMVREESSSKQKERYTYTVYSPRPERAKRLNRSNWMWPRAIETFARDQFTDLPTEDLQRLIELAREKSGIDNPGEKPSKLEMARRLEHYLRNSGEFRYSLVQVPGTPSMDPVEDFLFNRREGHCEYFASALALMLRAVDIPSRLVSGFKGGAINSISGDFEVQERHAHAWVEAAIGDQWVVLDATPAVARAESVRQFAPALQSWHDFIGMIKLTWTEYIVNMNYAHQRRNLYEPLGESLKRSWFSVTGGEGTVKGAVLSFKEFLSSPDRWISWQGGVITWILLFLLVGFVWMVRRGVKLMRKMRLRWRSRRSERNIRIEFFERFRKLCQSQGLVRGRTQTQREFALDVLRVLNGSLIESGLEKMPDDVVDCFYRVRFGDEQLNSAEIERIDFQLSRFEKALQPT